MTEREYIDLTGRERLWAANQMLGMVTFHDPKQTEKLKEIQRWLSERADELTEGLKIDDE